MLLDDFFAWRLLTLESALVLCELDPELKGLRANLEVITLSGHLRHIHDGHEIRVEMLVLLRGYLTEALESIFLDSLVRQCANLHQLVHDEVAVSLLLEAGVCVRNTVIESADCKFGHLDLLSFHEDVHDKCLHDLVLYFE